MKKYICENCNKSFNLTESAYKKRLRKKRSLNLCTICQRISQTENTFFEKYGIKTKGSAGIKEFYEKMKNTNKKNTGYEFHMKNPEKRKKANKTYELKTGYSNMLNNPISDKKRKNTNIKKYGFSNWFSSNVNKNNKSKECYNRLNKFKQEPKIPIQTTYIPIKTVSIAMLSRLSKKIEEMFKNGMLSNQFTYKKDLYLSIPNTNNKTGYTFDFGIYEDDKLNLLIDINNKNERIIQLRDNAIPKDVKIYIIDDNNIDNCIEEIINLLGIDFEGYVQYQYNLCREIDFPFYDYTDEELLKSWSQLLNYKRPLTGNTKGRVWFGDEIIHYFHPSIYLCRTKGNISPIDAWYDDELLLKCIRNRFIYVNHVNPTKVLQGFNINKIAPKISIFSAALAKNLIDKYLSGYPAIFDPFSGFSGRLLGAGALCIPYIGQDINKLAVQESNSIIKVFDIEAKIKRADSTKTTGEYPCLFTCPPYDNTEIWFDGKKEIETDISCDEWIDICLKNYKCKKYLFVVDNKCKNYDYHMVDIINNKSHFSHNYEKVILIEK
jgi:hypothetical protein